MRAKRYFRAVLLLSVALIVLPCLGLAETKEDADRLLKEAKSLQKGAVYEENLERAFQKYEEALWIFKQLGDLHAMASVYNMLGNAYRTRDDLQKAVDYYGKALETAQQVGDVRRLDQTP
jgi:tetratricopeptide (TPR) repeat protein